MDDGPAGHAMTEIALALAMSFFCLLVLALVTMGTPAPAVPADGRIEALAASWMPIAGRSTRHRSATVTGWCWRSIPACR